VFLISHTFTRPLASLVEGVRALEHGDFYHPSILEAATKSRINFRFRRACGPACSRLNRALLESEQLATIGRMPVRFPTISVTRCGHCRQFRVSRDGRLTATQREELYQEVRPA